MRRRVSLLLALLMLCISLRAAAQIMRSSETAFSYAGTWEDEITRRATMVAAQYGTHVEIRVRWSYGTNAAETWKISGEMNPETGMLLYNDAEYCYLQWDATGIETVVLADRSSGLFSWIDQKLRWQDTLIEGDGLFVKLSDETPGVEASAESDDTSGFVLLSDAVPDAILEIRYYSTFNFVGERIDGYEEPLAFLTREAAAALREVSDELLQKGYRLKIFDAYRPQSAVSHFVRWAKDLGDTRMKAYFYPELDKKALFSKGYIAEHSGHSRGSTVDLTLFDMAAGKEVDMGGPFDYFGDLSHVNTSKITEEQHQNRMLLREAMLAHGFSPLVEEWWHFTLTNEPYPNTYFTFPINSDSLRKVAR